MLYRSLDFSMMSSLGTIPPILVKFANLGLNLVVRASSTLSKSVLWISRQLLASACLLVSFLILGTFDD